MPREASIVRDAGKFLLADFPVCLVECPGHRVLCDLLRDLTARTNLVASLYQSTHDMRQSGADHARTDTAPVAGDAERAA